MNIHPLGMADKMDIPQVLLELHMHEKYTIVYFGKEGWPMVSRFFLRGTCRYASKLILLTIKPINAPVREILINADKQFIIWNDWCDPDCSIVVRNRIRMIGIVPMTMGQTWARFDPRYLIRAKQSIPAMPVVWNIKPVKPEEFHDLAFIHQPQ